MGTIGNDGVSLTLEPGWFYIGHWHVEYLDGDEPLGNSITCCYRRTGDRRAYTMHIRTCRYDVHGNNADKVGSTKEFRTNGMNDIALWRKVDHMIRQTIEEHSKDGARIVLAQQAKVMGDYERYLALLLSWEHCEFSLLSKEERELGDEAAG